MSKHVLTPKMKSSLLQSAVFRLATPLILWTHCALAWGPHPEITQAALNTLPREDGLTALLAADTQRLSQYVWMADWRQQLLVRADEVFYADDYLLFPKATTHSQHICPEVIRNYAPFFRRALQALRTESPRNAARWVGSLLHFTTDTGSPPHAAGFLGPAHSKMENWVDPKLILLPGYQPQRLGEDDASAEAGFLRRMDGLIEFSKERAARCRADVDADRREPVEPVVLESALETARVTADLLHTLGHLASRQSGGTSLSGTVVFPKIDRPPLERLPAKIVLLDTDYSTLSAPDGSFTFRHLPEGEYRAVVLAPGCTSELQSFALRAGVGVVLPEITLAAKTPGNLLRNADFRLRWVSGSGLDHWGMRTPPGSLAAKTKVRDWDGEWIPLEKGTVYTLGANWKKDAPGSEQGLVFLRTKPAVGAPGAPSESEQLTPHAEQTSVVGSSEAAWAQVCIRSPHPPETVLESIFLHRQ